MITINGRPLEAPEPRLTVAMEREQDIISAMNWLDDADSGEIVELAYELDLEDKIATYLLDNCRDILINGKADQIERGL